MKKTETVSIKDVEIWTDTRDKTVEQIDNLEKALIVNRAILTLAENKLIELDA